MDFKFPDFGSGNLAEMIANDFNFDEDKPKQSSQANPYQRSSKASSNSPSHGNGGQTFEFKLEDKPKKQASSPTGAIRPSPAKPPADNFFAKPIKPIPNTDMNDSRDIEQISYDWSDDKKSMHFDVAPTTQQSNPRYERIQKLLEKAKSQNLDAFYRSLDTMAANPHVAKDKKFESNEQFKEYVRKLKEQKRAQQDMFVDNQLKEGKQIKVFTKKEQINYAPTYETTPQTIASPIYKYNDTQGAPQNELKLPQFLKDSPPPVVGSFSTPKPPNPAKPLKSAPKNQDEKISRLMQTHQQLRSHFLEMINELRQTGMGQQQIIQEFNILKKMYSPHQLDWKPEEFGLRPEVPAENLQSAIVGSAEGQKQLISKMSQKIESLQTLIQQAISDIAAEKQTNTAPKVINYCGSSQSQRADLDNQGNGVKLASPSGFNANGEEDRVSQGSKIKSNLSQQNLTSPLLVDLNNQSGLMTAISFKAAEGAVEYHPRALDVGSCRDLRKCLMQRSSIVFQSFEFLVSVKYSVSEEQKGNSMCITILANMKVENKCAIDLFDLLIVPYGPYGVTIPSKSRPQLYFEELKHGSSLNFEMDIPRDCFDQNAFSMMISYRTDAMNKKKTNFKCFLPIAQLIKPEFIHESQFSSIWRGVPSGQELYIPPRTLDFRHIRSHEDLKLVLPFTEVIFGFTQLIEDNDESSFSYGICFKHPKGGQALFLLRLTCYVNGMASIHLRVEKGKGWDVRIKQELLDMICFLFLV